MHPSVIIALMLVAGTAGGLFYSYHIGRTQGYEVCNNEKLEAEIIKKEKELEQERELSKLQQDEIAEAQSSLDQQKADIDDLKIKLENASRGKSQCIPDSVLEELRKFRYGAKNKNS